MEYRRIHSIPKKVIAKIQVLRDFLIPVSEDMISTLENLYPSEIDMENYTRSVIMRYFDEREGNHK